MKPSRKKVNLKGKVVKHPTMAYFDIISSIHKLCENLTGHKIEKGEFEFTDDYFKYTKEYRQEILRGLNDKRSLIVNCIEQSISINCRLYGRFYSNDQSYIG